MRGWQKDFLNDIENMTNREVFDLYVAMENGSYWEQEDIDSDHSMTSWMHEETEHELDHRLMDWFDEDSEEVTDPEYDPNNYE